MFGLETVLFFGNNLQILIFILESGKNASFRQLIRELRSLIGWWFRQRGEGVRFGLEMLENAEEKKWHWECREVDWELLKCLPVTNSGPDAFFELRRLGEWIVGIELPGRRGMSSTWNLSVRELPKISILSLLVKTRPVWTWRGWFLDWIETIFDFPNLFDR